jgi:hypothetical protein
MMKMPWEGSLESIKSKELFGLTEYYDAVFSRVGLIIKEVEFRNTKLSLVLDLIGAVGLFNNSETDLMSTIIDAWRLQVPEKALIQREDELHTVLRSINSINSAVRRINEHDNPMARLHLGVAVLSSLPITSSDFQPEDAPRIFDLISQVTEQSLSLIEGKLNFSSQETAINSIS